MTNEISEPLAINQNETDVDEEVFLRSRNYAMWKRRSYKKDRKEPNIIIPFDTNLQKYIFNINLEISDSQREYIKKTINEFNNFIEHIPLSHNILRLIVLIIDSFILFIYVYFILLFVVMTLYNSFLIMIVLWTVKLLFKAFIFLDVIIKKKIRKRRLSRLIRQENRVVRNMGYVWEHGRNGYWLELIKI
jgi:hypothetical protein